ncbi:uncharacterized protein BJ171DRAFT_503938 [Polychytrium aggregatum]|uniref:uncharacterized protein n=1 Tax=Polychytrium aggregatum TaxID=110093 RepID=UPI0022FE2E01|nr:uncharacterized protein BJ171DRAFT_503938 [Polychytrium aggregatum]KAI9204878.1 hypothetical protein BJ171DRAFT_503938 [Polychytrium aggregatum]
MSSPIPRRPFHGLEPDHAHTPSSLSASSATPPSCFWTGIPAESASPALHPHLPASAMASPRLSQHPQLPPAASPPLSVECRSVLVVASLLIDHVGPVEWTKLCSLSRHARALLSQPMYWKILFREYFGFPARSIPSHQIAHLIVAADSFLNRTRPDPHPCELILWQNVHLYPQLLDSVRALAQEHRSILWARWPHASSRSQSGSSFLWDWMADGSFPDTVGLHDFRDYGLYSGYGCKQLPETTCFWRPTAMVIQSRSLAELPASFGCLAKSLVTLWIQDSPLYRLPDSLSGSSHRVVVAGAPCPPSPVSLAADTPSATPCRSPVDPPSPMDVAWPLSPISSGISDPMSPSATASSCIGSPLSSDPLPLEADTPSSMEDCSIVSIPPPSLAFSSLTTYAAPPLTELRLVGCANLECIAPIAGFSSLKTLHLANCPSLRSIEPVRSLSSLEHLTLSKCIGIVSLSPLAALQSLSDLDLSQSPQIESLEPLRSLAGLRELHLQRCRSISCIEPLRNLRRLTKLNLDYCTLLPSLDPLSDLRELVALSVAGCSLITTLWPLRSVTSLQDLNCSECPKLASLAGLESLAQLRILNAAGCVRIASIEPVARLSMLRNLDLLQCEGIVSIEPLRELTGLQSLDLGGCTLLTSIKPIASLSALYQLNLQECCRIESLGPLAGLGSLEWLKLTECTSVSSIQPLSALSQLKALYLDGCSRISDLRPLAALRVLNVLDLAGLSSVRSLDPLLELHLLCDLNLGCCTAISSLKPLASLRSLARLSLCPCHPVPNQEEASVRLNRTREANALGRLCLQLLCRGPRACVPSM